MRCCVTGAAGFIGSNLVDRLLADGHTVVGLDNLSTGRMEFLWRALATERFRLLEGDLEDRALLVEAVSGCDLVFHMAANADVRFGTRHPRKDLEVNTIGTVNVLDAMRSGGVRKIAFASTGSIYGEAEQLPTPEDAPVPVQTSLYGASKFAAEGFIEAYCEGFDFQAWIFRFVSILGERYSHGHVYDFVRSLRSDSSTLHILGDGLQRKSYLYVGDCIEAIIAAIGRTESMVNIFNLGTDQYCTVNDSVGWIVEELGLSPRLTYSGGSRGWIGDNPFIFLDTSRIRRTGWQPKLSIRDGVIRTVRYLRDHPWVLDGAEAPQSSIQSATKPTSW